MDAPQAQAAPETRGTPIVRRFFTRFLIVLLIGFCGYNWVQTRMLQAQVNDLEARQIVQAKQVREQADWIARANAQAQTAREALSRSDWRGAERGLSQGVQDLQSGVRAAVQSPQTRRSLHTLQDLQRQADALWQRTKSMRERK